MYSCRDTYNRAMSVVRVTVEWTLGKIVQLFAYLDFKKNQKVLLQLVGKYDNSWCPSYKLSYLFVRITQTTDFFSLTPPTVEVYFTNQ